MTRCMVVRGADPEHMCMGCGHFHGSHLFPSGICMECVEHELTLVGLHTSMQTRLDQLGFAVQHLSERMDNAHLDRLDVICSSWPKRLRTVHPGDEVWMGEDE